MYGTIEPAAAQRMKGTPGSMKKLPASFFRTASGTEPVREWLLSLDSNDRRLIGFDIATVELGWPVGMPTCRPMKKGLWEIRTDLPDGRIARVFFCIEGNSMVLLHGIIKKSQGTPPKALDLARGRQKEVQR